MSRVRRRQFLAASAGLAAARLLHAQPEKVPTLGILSPHPRPRDLVWKDDNPISGPLIKRGWVIGRTLHIERPDAGGREDLLPKLAWDLVANKVDVIWANGPEAAIAAAQATSTIPIVFWGVGFPVEQGLVASLARPGGNATGVAWYASPEVDGKRLELLKQIAPQAKRLAFLTVPSAVRSVKGGQALIPSTFVDAGKQLGYEMQRFTVEKAEDFDDAFRAILAWRAESITVAGTTVTVRATKRIVEFANSNRLPSAYTLRDFVEAGGLVSYAIDWRPTVARSMEYVDRILRGAKPAELAVDLPAEYQTAVNLKTAKLLGLNVPQWILLRADRIIE
jgi:putative tryptophan/tyrosine transport system substrate-binding protein